MNAIQDATTDADTPLSSYIGKERIGVRAYRPADHPTLLALWAEAELAPFTEAEVARLLNSGGGALVAEATAPDGVTTIVGTLFWSHNGHIGLLWKLAVRRGYRQRGIARRMLHQVECDVAAAGLAGVALLTHNTNTPARNLYKREGWTHRTHNEYWVKRVKRPIEETIAEEEQTTC